MYWKISSLIQNTNIEIYTLQDVFRIQHDLVLIQSANLGWITGGEKNAIGRALTSDINHDAEQKKKW
jgi:hypothetical protein